MIGSVPFPGSGRTRAHRTMTSTAPTAGSAGDAGSEGPGYSFCCFILAGLASSIVVVAVVAGAL